MVDGLLERFELPLTARACTLSLGQTQSVALILALGSRPDLLVLDEPASGLDPVARRHFLNAMIDVALDGNRAIVLSTHLVTDLDRIANRLMVMDRGRMKWDGELDELKSSVKHVRLVGGDLCKRPDWPEITSWQQEGDSAVATVFGNIDDLALRLHALLGANVTVEDISLEDILVAMHQ